MRIANKPLYVLLLALCAWTSALAWHEYRPMVVEGRLWNLGLDTFVIEGDTIIDGKTCKRMMLQEYAKEGSYAYDAYYHKDAPLRYIGAWYEENQKVYFAAPDQQLHLTYDFSVSEDDTFSVFADGSYQKFKLFSKRISSFKPLERLNLWKYI